MMQNIPVQASIRGLEANEIEVGVATDTAYHWQIKFTRQVIAVNAL
jgi:hypothetical protein